MVKKTKENLRKILERDLEVAYSRVQDIEVQLELLNKKEEKNEREPSRYPRGI